MQASIPALSRQIPFSPEAANLVASVGAQVYDLLASPASSISAELSSQNQSRAIAAYMVIASYESSNDFGCDFVRKMQALGINDSVSAGDWLKEQYLDFPGIYESKADANNRAIRRLEAGQGAGTDLFLYRLIVLMSGAAPPAVTITEKTTGKKDPCASEDPKWFKYVKYGSIGLAGVLVGYLAYRAIK
jgi:hypothetical protein